MGTKTNPGRFDCYAQALPDEPLFTLLGRSPEAPELVEQWADLREAAITAGERPEADRDSVAEARGAAIEMRAWREANDGKWREPPVTGSTSRSIGGETSSAELATLAGQVLADPQASEREKRLAGSVLTQFEAKSAETPAAKGGR